MKNFSPKNKIYGFIRISMVAITIVSTVGFSPLTVLADEIQVPANENCYVIDFIGKVNNSDGTSTWNYTISQKDNCQGPELSHWMWSPCFAENNLNERIVSVYPEGAEIGFDGSTLHYGVKWEADGINWDTYFTFGIIIIGQPEISQTGTIGVIKAGQAGDQNHGNQPHFDMIVPGPSCEPIVLPICGDGTINQISEQCDDGNLVSGDGCDSQCQIEIPQLCAPGETLREYTYNSKPQFVYIDNSTQNVVNQLCTDSGSYLSVDTSNGLPHYIYLTWDNVDISNYPNFLSFDLLLNHKESSSTIKVELKNQFGTWIEVCDPAESSVFTWNTCDLVPFSHILKEVEKVELRIVAKRAGACHAYLKCAKLEVELYNCEAPEPWCGDGVKNQLTEQCDGTDWVGEHQACTQDCKLIDLPWCGDGIKNQDSEQCDGADGVGDHQRCDDSCALIDIPYCGNDVKDEGEECDGQDGVSEHYTCTAQCTLEYIPYCGDGTVNQVSEQCDDGNLVNGDGCSMFCQIELPVCDKDVELVKNGGFESPLIADSQSWSIFADSVLGGWRVEWVSLTPAEYNGYSRPVNAYLEFQNDLTGWAAQEGNQYAELDSDWDGYGGSLNGEPASVKIYQDITTIPGETYTVSFWFSPRPGTAVDNNRLEFSWNGSVVDNNIQGAGENTTVWIKHTHTLVATSNSTRIQFADIGVPSDSFGTFLDNVSVRCGTIEPEPYCGDNIKNQETEQCDGQDGVSENYICTTQCTLEYVPYCGDGNIDVGEECDNKTLNGQTCSPACGSTCSYCSAVCTIVALTGGTCGGGGGGGGGGDSYYPALAISKFVIEDVANPGQVLHYTIILKNNGNATATSVKLTDTLPAGFTFNDTGLAYKEWDLGDMAMGVEKITNYEVLVGQDVVPGDYQNIASAKATNQGIIYAKALTVILGEVLGERIVLPDTGVDPIWFTVVGLGLVLISLLTIVAIRRTMKIEIKN